MHNEKYTDVKVTNVFRKTEKAKGKIIVNEGGAGSSKSFSLCQFFIFKRLLVKRNYKLLVLRKIRHANKMSVYQMFIEILNLYGIYKDVSHNKSDMVYRIPELNNEVRFTGLDDREQIKSTEWHDIWLEEANEFSREDLTFLKTRLYRGAELNGDIPRIWLSYNPESCWIWDLEGTDGIEFIKSSYKDNPFCNEEYKKTLEALKDEDDVYYKIYALGERARAGNLIYKPYIMESKFPETYDDKCYGLDFGFNNQSALLHIGFKDDERYLTELLYQTKLTNADLIEKLKILIPEDKRDITIYADSAEPQRIQEICNAGFYCMPASKEKNSVKDGIDHCKRKKYHTLSTNVNLNKENASYRYKKDKDGNTLEEPVKFKDHLMDAKRYADYTHTKGQDINILW